MSDVSKIILSLGVAVAACAIGFAIADHIRDAQTVELTTNKFQLASHKQYLL